MARQNRLSRLMQKLGTLSVLALSVSFNIAGNPNGTTAKIQSSGVPATFYSFYPEVRLREHSGGSTVNILREGDLSVSSSVEFMTLETEWMRQNAAIAGKDYISTSGTLAFEPGETKKQITIQLLDDRVAETPRMFEVVLTNATGRNSEWFHSAQIWIDDDDFNPLPVDSRFHTLIKYRSRSEVGDDLTLTALPDGKFVIPASVTTVDGENAWVLARLYPNGERDDTFVSPVFPSYPVFALQSDGHAIVSSELAFRADSAFRFIARLRTDGSFDTAFLPPEVSATALAMQKDGKVLVAAETSFMRLETDGSLDTTFQKLEVEWEHPSRARITVDPQGRVIVQPVSSVNGKISPGIARILPDGSVDDSFCREVSEVGYIETLEIAASGTLLATYLDQEFSLVLVRLLDDGKLDPAFRSALHHSQYRFVPISDEKIIILDRDSYTAQVIRLNADGTLDDSFRPATYSVRAFGLDGVGRAIVNGELLLLGDGGLMVNGRVAPVRLQLEPAVPRLELAYDSASVEETGGAKELKLVRTGPDLGELTVHWETTAEGTARPGVDFVAGQGHLVFAEGQTDASITITLLDNNLLDGERNATISLTSAAGPLPPVNLTIVNDDLGISSQRLLRNGFTRVSLTGNQSLPCRVETSDNLRQWNSSSRASYASEVLAPTAQSSMRFFRLARDSSVEIKPLNN